MDVNTSNELRATAQAMVAPGKGILAADESYNTANKRFEKLGIPTTEEMRRAYREMLFTAPGIGDFFSGVILFDETIRQSTKTGTPFPQVLIDAGIIPGIKLDTGAKPLANAPGELITEGLDGLRDRILEYYNLGHGLLNGGRSSRLAQEFLLAVALRPMPTHWLAMLPCVRKEVWYPS